MEDNLERIRDDRTEEEKLQDRKKGRLVTIGSMIVIALTGAGILYMGFAMKYFGIGYKAYIVAGFLLFWLLTDVVRPRLAHEFTGKTPDQIKAYMRMAAFELFGYAGLIYFCFSFSSQTGFYGVLLYAFCTMMKRRFLDEFNKDPEETQAASEESHSSLHNLRTALSGTAAGSQQAQEEHRSIRDIASMATAEIEDADPETETVDDAQAEED